MEQSFGFRTVEAGAKQPLVDEVFHKVARRYDLMNDIMSAGMHRVWKDAMVAALNPPKRAGWTSLDVAGGTGDIAFRIVEASGRTAHVTVLDINGSMLGVGRERAEKRGLLDNLDFVEANAEALPFEDEGFDAYTIAFGIRNVPRIDVALSEAFRVLKPGGRFLCSTGPTKPGRSTPFRRSARWSPATASPIATWWNRSPSSPGRPISPR